MLRSLLTGTALLVSKLAYGQTPTWEADMVPGAENGLPLCTAGVSFSNEEGFFESFTIKREFGTEEIYIQVSNSAWEVLPSGKFITVYQFSDITFVFAGISEKINITGLPDLNIVGSYIPESSYAAFVRELERQRYISFIIDEAKGSEMRFPLAGSSAAIEQMNSCMGHQDQLLEEITPSTSRRSAPEYSTDSDI